MIHKFIYVFNVAFCIVFGWILLLVAGNMVKKSILSVILLIPVLVLLIHFLKKPPQNIRDKDYGKIWMIVQAVSAVLMVIIAFSLEVVYSWDWGRLLITASNFVDTGMIDDAPYFARYPNNQFWLMILIWLFRLVRVFVPGADMEVLKDISIVVSCILVQITIFIIYRTARQVWNERKAFYVGMMAVLCLPLYLFAQYAYTDTSGMLVCALLLYLYVRLRQSGGMAKKAYLILLGFTAALAYEVKVTVFIVFIAIAVDSITRIQNMKKYVVCAVMVMSVVIITVLSVNKLVEINVKIDEKLAENERFPLTHWVMMSFNEHGGYSQEDVDYTRNHHTYEGKKRADERRLKKRIERLGTEGVIKHMGYTKLLRTWGHSSLCGDEYVNRYPLQTKYMGYKLFALDGKYHKVSQTYMDVYYLIFMAGIFLSAVLLLGESKEKQPLLFTRIAIFGFCLFMCIWECNARYMVALLPVFIITSADGLSLLSEKLRREKQRNRNRYFFLRFHKSPVR